MHTFDSEAVPGLSLTRLWWHKWASPSQPTLGAYNPLKHRVFPYLTTLVQWILLSCSGYCSLRLFVWALAIQTQLRSPPLEPKHPVRLIPLYVSYLVTHLSCMREINGETAININGGSYMAAAKKQNVLPSPVFSLLSIIPAAISICHAHGTIGNSRIVVVRRTASAIFARNEPTSHLTCSYTSTFPPENTLLTRTSPISFQSLFFHALGRCGVNIDRKPASQ